ncbi:MAG: PVC-type heme-binding CxxCH protein, partial [Planctomycetota bacterium]|nr:PVC-type heme-binding CxxCH protein [Planctomycetota bacterium]
KVFVQEKGLVAPLGICVLGNEVFVSCSPDIIKYTDTDGDDVPDKREVFLTGFGGHDHDHGVHSVVPGPDGKLYIAVGNAGPHVVQDAAGWTLRSGSIYGGWGPKSGRSGSGLVSDDGRLWTGGMVLRINPDGTGLEVVAHNFRNNYEVAIDSFGNLWQSDNDDDGNRSCRTTWVMPGGNYGFFSNDGTRSWQADRRPGQETITAHWHQDDPGVVPAGCINGAGGPTGVAVYEGGLLPASWIGRVLNCDAGRNVVYAHTPVRKGAGFDLEPGFIIRARLDRNAQQRQRWFRPSDVAVGTDGAVYVADWYDPGVGGHAAGDREAYGRIVRIAPEGAPTAVGMVDPKKDWRTALRSPAASVRWQGRVAAKGASTAERIAELTVATERGDDRHMAHALWLLQGESGSQEDLVKLLAASDAKGSLALAEVVFRALPAARLKDVIQVMLNPDRETSATVLREIALAARKEPAAAREPLAMLLATRLPPGDRWYLEALGDLARGIEPGLWDRVSKLHGEGGLTDSQVLDLAFRLHPPKAAVFLATKGMDKALEPASRRRAVDGLAFIDTREAADAMVNLALAGSDDIRALARWWVEHKDRHGWKRFRIGRELGATSLEGGELMWNSGVMKGGTKEVDVDVSGIEALWLVVTDGGDGYGCDWAAWIDPRLEGPAGTLHLSKQPWDNAIQGWGQTRVGRNAGGGPIKIDGKEYGAGVGTHANSRIGWLISNKGYKRFKATVGPDDGGTTQASGKTSIEFQVWAKTRVDTSWIAGLKRTVLDGAQAMDDRQKAARRLAADPKGGHVILDLVARDQLDGKLKAAVTEDLFKNPDLTVRALASARFPRTNLKGVALPPIAELAKMPGDWRRGREVFFGTTSQCSKCHTYGARGGNTGPDLTAVSQKYGKKELLDHILNPSAAIAFGYDAWIVTTKDDDLYSGFILADGDYVIIKDADGRRHVIPADQVDSRRKESSSTMPDTIALGLEPRQLADLVAFLSAGGAKPKPKQAVSLFNGKDLAGWTHHLSKIDVARDAVWSVLPDGILDCKGGPSGYIRTEKDYANFILELDWRFPGRPGNSGVLLRMVGEDKVWPKSIEADLVSHGAGDILNMGDFEMEVDEDRTRGARTQKIHPTNERPIGQWNQYKITLFGGDLTLEVNGKIQNVGRWCEELPGKIGLQSGGAHIQFRNIRLTPLER